MNVVTGDHNRVRENLRIVPMTSEHYKTFLEKFVVQDKQIEKFQQNVRELNGALQTQIRDPIQIFKEPSHDTITATHDRRHVHSQFREHHSTQLRPFMSLSSPNISTAAPKSWIWKLSANTSFT